MSLKKRRGRYNEDEKATGLAFQEFLNEFQSTTPKFKSFMKSGIYNSESDTNLDATEKSKVYTPIIPKYKNNETIKSALECANLAKNLRGSKPMNEKHKSNLIQLKEELEQEQMHMAMKERLNQAKTGSVPTQTTNTQTAFRKTKEIELNSFDTTTNLFVSSLDPTINEQHLMQLFGSFGPLASVKIMWPRPSDKVRSSNIGFVAFMSRIDCKRAFYRLQHRTDMHITWGKPIDIPSKPVYIPPEMLQAMLPPLPSGLPFNAQAPHLKSISNDKLLSVDDVDLSQTFVHVTIPTNKKVLCAIHRTIEFVVREGYLIETIIKKNEIHNSTYAFLIDNKSAAHTYYRWKLYSILHGESINAWSAKPFRMFSGGSIWIPPTIPDYTKGMPVKSSNKEPTHEMRLLDSELDGLIKVIQELTVDKKKIAGAMMFCMSKLHAPTDIIDIIAESLSNTSDLDKTPSQNSKQDLKDRASYPRGMKQIARLYLLSDILYQVKDTSSQFVIKCEAKIISMFESISATLKFDFNQDNLYAAMNYLRVKQVIKAWRIWKIFSADMLRKLECVLQNHCKFDFDDSSSKPIDAEIQVVLTTNYQKENCIIDKTAGNGNDSKLTGTEHTNYVKSRWETEPAETHETQIVSSPEVAVEEIQKRPQEDDKSKKTSNDLDIASLRQVEIKVIQYQDSLEGGKRKLKYAQTIEEEIKEYRERCIKKMKLKKHEEEENFKGYHGYERY